MQQTNLCWNKIRGFPKHKAGQSIVTSTTSREISSTFFFFWPLWREIVIHKKSNQVETDNRVYEKNLCIKWRKKWQNWWPPEPLRRDYEFGIWSAPIPSERFLNFPTSTPPRALYDSLSELISHLHTARALSDSIFEPRIRHDGGDFIMPWRWVKSPRYQRYAHQFV